MKNTPVFSALFFAALPLQAAPIPWSGTSNSEFESSSNWGGGISPANDLLSDVAVFHAPTPFQPKLTSPRSISGLLFSTPGGGWTLSDTSPTLLTLGGSGISTNGQTSGTNIISCDLTLGSAQAWAVASGGTLLLTGSLTGSSAFPLTVNSVGNLGTLILSPAGGRSVQLTGTSSSNFLLIARQGGLLMLGGDGVRAPLTESVNTLTNTGTFGTLTLTGSGAIEAHSGTWNFGDLARNSSSDYFSGSLALHGGEVSFKGARFLAGGTITVTGGSLRFTNVGSVFSNGGKFALGSAPGTGTGSLTISGGLVDLAQANGAVGGGNSLGIGMNARAVQTGGVLQNGLTLGGGTNGGTTASFSLGHSGMTTSGSGTTLTHTPVSNMRASYTLAGGTFLNAGAIQATPPAASGTNGSAANPPNAVVEPGTGNLRNFNFTGGTLASASFVATHLGYASATGVEGGPPHTDPAANSVGIGTLYNHGGILAPGGVGTVGRTTITGNYIALAGTLSLDLAGSTAATAFQGSSGQHDLLSVSGTTTLQGNLAVSVLPGFSPAANQTFNVVSSPSGLSGAFANVASGGRLLSTDGLHSFVVTLSTTGVSLSQYLPVTAPTVASTSSPEVMSEGDAVVLGITTNSLAEVTYEWRRDGILLPGATSSSLVLLNLSAAETGNYEVLARNAAGSVSHTFRVAITTPPSAGALLLDAGNSAPFAATPGASSYRWVLDGDEVGTGATFTYSPTQKAVGTHWLRLVETYTDGSTITRHWSIRVRIPIPTSSLTYYVSPQGSDTAAGTIGAPFRTLERARDVIRTLPRPLPAGGVTVFLRGGLHRRTTTFALGAQDSGAASAPIIYTAFPGETPILTGARAMAASSFAPLAASEHFRVAPGIDPARIWELDVTGNPRANTFPNVFNEWWIFNALRSSQNGGLFELFADGERLPISRYPNHHPTDDTLTPALTMDGIATGLANDGSGYLNSTGTYTDSAGQTHTVGGAFHFRAEDASRVARWQTALSRGGLWLAGYWRVPWQVNGVKIGLLDTGSKRVIALANGAAVSNGIGNKYTRPIGNKKEPFWVINLLEELDETGEWCIDFSRRRLYLLRADATQPAEGSVEISDLSTPLVQANAASYLYFQKLTFQRQLGHSIQILGGNNNLVLGCTFRQTGNCAVDINGGTNHGVVSSDLEQMAAGGILLRGGTITPSLVPSNHFAVNNKFRGFGEVVRVYQGAIDSGSGGPLGSSSQVSVGTRIAHNDLKTTPHGGIYWGSYNHVLEYNEISDFVRVSEDMGGIYRFGPNYESGTVIRYNHAHHSPLGEAYYNDMDHVKVAMYGNVANLRTNAAGSRGVGFWTNTNTAAGGAVPGLTMALNLQNNISVNGRDNYSLHSSTGGVIQNNLSYRPLAYHFEWFRVSTNTTTNTHSITTSNAATLQSGPNPTYSSDPGFIDFDNDDLRLRPDAQAYRDMPGFIPIPLEMSGLYNDEYRSDARVWTPFVVTERASSIGANSATFNGTLVYPQFDRNATVRLYYGTTDGGTDPQAWSNVVVLGTPGSGNIAHTPTHLSPSTRYFFRFHATNSSGEHWSENSNSTTTFSASTASIGGLASANTGSSSAPLAFDGNPATAWQASPGSSNAILTYRFANETAVRVTQYRLTSAADAPGRDPRDWQLEGSYDGLDWVVLDSRSGQTFASRGTTLTYGFHSTASFKFYRLNILAHAGDPAGPQLAEFLLLKPDTAPDTTGPVITTPGSFTTSGTSTGAYVNFEVSAVDALSGNATAVASPVSGSFFNLGNTTVTVTATDAAGNLSTATFVVTVLPPPLPAPWTIQQIRPYTGTAAGTATVNSATSFTIAGTGGSTSGGTTGDIWTGSNDSFTFVSQPWSGDGVFTARIASFSAPDASAKAGIMFRESTATGARYSATYMLRKGDAWAQHKTATNGGSTNVNFFTANSNGRGIPEWVRLVRQGDTFTCYVSPDGATWTQLGTTRTNLLSGSNLRVGLAVGPRTGGQTATVTFDNISFLTPQQVWRQSYFATTNATGNAADLADPDGDGRSNLLEYALGTSPTVATAGEPVLMNLLTIEPSPDPHLSLTFQRIADPQLLYSVEATNELSGGWTTLWSSTGASNVAGAVTVTDSTNLGTTARRFLRLKVEPR